MTFSAILFFKIKALITFDEGDEKTYEVSGLPPIKFSAGDKADSSFWATASMHGFDTVADAAKSGRWLQDTLSTVGAITQLGVDVRDSQQVINIGEVVYDEVRTTTGRDLFILAPGLSVRPSGSMLLHGSQASFIVGICIDDFAQRIKKWIGFSSHMTERQRLSSQLINSSYFSDVTEAQFILRISAIEALCEKSLPDTSVVEAIQIIENFVRQQDFDLTVSDSLNAIIQAGKRTSIRQGYMSKIRSLISEESAQKFDELYKIRSKLLHTGKVNHTLQEENMKLLVIALELLEADILRLTD